MSKVVTGKISIYQAVDDVFLPYRLLTYLLTRLLTCLLTYVHTYWLAGWLTYLLTRCPEVTLCS